MATPPPTGFSTGFPNTTSSAPSTFNTVTTQGQGGPATKVPRSPSAFCGNPGDNGAFRLDVRLPVIFDISYISLADKFCSSMTFLL
jgi:hypothetical protein